MCIRCFAKAIKGDPKEIEILRDMLDIAARALGHAIVQLEKRKEAGTLTEGEANTLPLLMKAFDGPELPGGANVDKMAEKLAAALAGNGASVRVVKMGEGDDLGDLLSKLFGKG